jgi:hypothetical protein
MPDTGVAPKRIEGYVSSNEFEKIRASWTSGENSESLAPQSLLTAAAKPLLQVLIASFGNLIDLWPPLRHREVYMPDTTPEQDTQEAWRDVGRDLCRAGRPEDYK